MGHNVRMLLHNSNKMEAKKHAQASFLHYKLRNAPYLASS